MFGWEHGGFIVIGYSVTAIVVLGLIVWTIGDYRAQRRRIAELEARGARRRSSSAGGQPAAGMGPAV